MSWGLQRKCITYQVYGEIKVTSCHNHVHIVLRIVTPAVP